MTTDRELRANDRIAAESRRTGFSGIGPQPTQTCLILLSWSMAASWSASCRSRESDVGPLVGHCRHTRPWSIRSAKRRLTIARSCYVARWIRLFGPSCSRLRQRQSPTLEGEEG